MIPFDNALHQYFYEGKSDPLILHNSYGEPEEMPIEVFFREDISELEEIALNFCDGNVLDVGAGVGVHSLLLQNSEISVTAIDESLKACEIMRERGVKEIVCNSFYRHQGIYDTLLFLMNGFGLAGRISNGTVFFNTLRGLLKPGGKVIIDSSDVTYMYNELPKDHYFGEVSFCYEYEHIIGEWFDWIYIDQQNLMKIASENDWDCQILFEDQNDQYLAVLQPI